MLDTLVVALVLTLPNTKAAVQWVPPSDRSAFEDSMVVTCNMGTEPITDLDSLFLYGSPVEGGGYRKVYGRQVHAMEGDTAHVELLLPWAGGHFYATTKRGVGYESCASNEVYVGTITGVTELPAPPLRNYRPEWYDVRGRRLEKLPANGIVFLVWRVDGKLQKPGQRVPFYFGRPAVKLKGPHP